MLRAGSNPVSRCCSALSPSRIAVNSAKCDPSSAPGVPSPWLTMWSIAAFAEATSRIGVMRRLPVQSLLSCTSGDPKGDRCLVSRASQNRQ